MKIVLVLAGLVLAVPPRPAASLDGVEGGSISRTYPGRMNHGQIGPAFLTIQGLLEPEKRHAAEEQTALRTEEDESGGPEGEQATVIPRSGERRGIPYSMRVGEKPRDPSLRSG